MATTCANCQQPIVSSYFTVGDKVACERCKFQLEAALAQPVGFGGFMRSLLLGSAAGLAGAAVWWGIRTATQYELGLIAIAIGYFVGMGVRSGSRGLGGLGFQILAVLLTYFWIAANYVPDVLAGWEAGEQAAQQEGGAEGSGEGGASGDPSGEQAPAPLRIAVAFALALALPFMLGFENVIGIAIIAFGLYQAWAMNRRAEIAVAGPFSLAPGAPATPA
jgi:hypothetical protein